MPLTDSPLLLYLQNLTITHTHLDVNTHTHMLTHTITLSFSLSTTFNSLWKRQVQTLIEPEPDLAPALSVRPAVLSNPLRSMSSQPGSQQAGRQPGKQPVNQAAPSGQRGPTAFPRPQIQPRFTGLIGQTAAGHRTVPSPITAPVMQDVLEAGRGGDPQSLLDLHPFYPQSSC